MHGHWLFGMNEMSTFYWVPILIAAISILAFGVPLIVLTSYPVDETMRVRLISNSKKSHHREKSYSFHD